MEDGNVGGATTQWQLALRLHFRGKGWELMSSHLSEQGKFEIGGAPSKTKYRHDYGPPEGTLQKLDDSELKSRVKLMEA